MNEDKRETPDTPATTAVLINVENEIPSISNLVKKKLAIKQKFKKFKRKLLITIIQTSLLLIQNLISQKQKLSLQD